MKLKNHLTFGSWAFYIGEGDEQIRVPAQGYLRTRRSLVNAVRDTLTTLAAQGQPDFLRRAEEEAGAVDMSIGRYIETLVEHQICLRMSNNRQFCLPSGIGDKLHSFVASVDSAVSKAPSPVRRVFERVAEAVTKKVSGEAHKRLSGCSACGGSRSFRKDTWNLGRAGRLR